MSEIALYQRPNAETALGLWLASFRSDATKRAYRRELLEFAAFVCDRAFCPGDERDVAGAISAFLALEDGPAHAVVAAWRQDKLRRGLAPASINRALFALASFVRAARSFGATALRLDIRGESSRAYRDTKGPGVNGVRKLLAEAAKQKNPRKAIRDVAILRLAFERGLRRGEIIGLDAEHVDLVEGTVLVMGKGRGDREPLTIPPATCAALAAWLEIRGDDKGPALFMGLSTGESSKRLTGAGIYDMIQKLGKKAGIKARPHGLRHAAITTALDAFGGNYRQVKSFSRHKNLNVIERYDDNRADAGGQVAAALSAIVAE